MGKTDGRKQGAVEQAKLDEEKMQKMRVDHDRDRNKWKEIDKEKDDIIEDLCGNN